MGIYILPSFAMGGGDLKKKKIHIDPLIPPPRQRRLFIPTYWLSKELDSACVYSQTLSSSRPRLAEPTKIIAPGKEELDNILAILLIMFTETLRLGQKSNRMSGNSAKDIGFHRLLLCKYLYFNHLLFFRRAFFFSDVIPPLQQKRAP